MWYARTTWQRSSVPGAAKLVTEHGHAKSQLQFSKYVPSTVQLMGTPPIRALKSSRSVLRSRARAFAPCADSESGPGGSRTPKAFAGGLQPLELANAHADPEPPGHGSPSAMAIVPVPARAPIMAA